MSGPLMSWCSACVLLIRAGCIVTYSCYHLVCGCELHCIFDHPTPLLILSFTGGKWMIVT